MSLIDFVFWKLRTPKTQSDKRLKSPVSEDRSFDKQHGKRAQALLKSASQHFYHIHWSLAEKLSLEKSPLLTCQLLRLLVSTLATDEKNPVLNRENLMISIHMQLSQKQKHFSEFCCYIF